MFTLFVMFLATPQGAASGPEEPVPAQGRVVEVYDGDTLTLASGDKIRLRWVNTPELRPKEDYGIEDREAARQGRFNKRR